MPSLRIVDGDDDLFLFCKVSLGLAGVADHTRFPATEMRALKHRSLKKKKKERQSKNTKTRNGRLQARQESTRATEHTLTQVNSQHYGKTNKRCFQKVTKGARPEALRVIQYSDARLRM